MSLRNKKAQLEIFGVIIVVMLIFLGMYFMITTGSTKRSNVKESYIAHQIGANTLNSLLATKIVCTSDYNLTLTELLQNCATYDDIYCDQTVRLGYDENKMLDACEFSNLILARILNETLNKWKVSYILNITKDDTDFTNPAKNYRIEFVNPKVRRWRNMKLPGCMKKYGGKAKMFPVPLYPGTLWIELFICNN